MSLKGINFHENLFGFFLFIDVRISFSVENYFTYFVKIKFSKFHKKDILPVAVTFL